MNKVIAINLNGNAYQLEEPGYNALRTYLEQAEKTLAGNPDKDEIMADFEQAIADKCNAFLRADKTVVTEGEVTEILAGMGPVEDAQDEAAADGQEQRAESGAPKRLYKVRSGAIFEGVCNGIAAYFNVDPTVVRVLFVVLTVLTGGGFIFAYILMAVFLPEARTAEDFAAAQGKPFNAQSFLADASAKYQAWKDSGYKDGKKIWGQYSDETKEQWEAYKQRRSDAFHNGTASLGFRAKQVVSIVLIIIFALVMAGLTVALSLGLASVFQSGQIAGYFAATPKWALATTLVATYLLLFIPVVGIVDELGCVADPNSRRSPFWRATRWVVWIVAAIVAVVAVAHYPQLQNGLSQLTHDISAHLK